MSYRKVNFEKNYTSSSHGNFTKNIYENLREFKSSDNKYNMKPHAPTIKNTKKLNKPTRMNRQSILTPIPKKTIQIQTNKEKVKSLSDPNVWGPSFWFILHNGAAHYPIRASPIVVENTKGFIKSIPEMLPCKTCSVHARTFIDKNEKDMNMITSGRDRYFKFYVDFHNEVNKRNGKRVMSLEEARKMYSGGVIIDKFSFNSTTLNKKMKK